MATCAGCRKSITGAYITALDKQWHRECFQCAACAKRIEGSFLDHDGKAYHADCYHQRFSPRCARDNQPITGAYITAMDKTWHAECFRCEQCGKPFRGKQYMEHDGRPYCEDCYHELFSPRCAVCGDPLRKEFLINSWGDQFHARHKDEHPECYSCGRLLCKRMTNGGVTYGDGRAMCNLCLKTAIDAVDNAQPTVRRVLRFLAQQGLDLQGAQMPVRLVDQHELLRQNTKHYTQRPAGMTCQQEHTQNGRVARREITGILILHGLPGEHFAMIAAHEYGHAWLFLNGYPALPPLVEEGLCELCAYLWLTEQATREARHRLQGMHVSDDPVYGAGFRAAYASLQRVPLAQLLDHVRRNAALP